jgi:crotonobetainyl-CoA:carnitine CoA-transferase CaiB-like acyl-CoA transferase
MLSTLSGIKVLDFGIYFSGPYSSRLLADLGADVIKLETLEGDLLRPTVKPFNAGARGKRSIGVDLKNPAGLEVAHRLAAWADVATHNMRPGVVERLAMDYTTLRSINPEIIYAWAPGWGSSGPDADRPGFAPLFGGFCGLQHEAAGEGNTPVPPVGNEDNGNGLVGAGAILMALYHRKRTGKGQYLENPQLNATLLMGMHLMRRPDGSVAGGRSLDHDRLGIHPLDRIYPTADGWLAISARLDREFELLCTVPGFEAIAADERYGTDELRRTQALDLQSAITGVLARETASSWAGLLDASGVPCEVCAGSDAQEQFFDDPHHVGVGRVEHYEHAVWGEVQDVGVMLRLSNATSKPGRPAPMVGEHTDEILDMLGYSEDDAVDLRGDSAVR